MKIVRTLLKLLAAGIAALLLAFSTRAAFDDPPRHRESNAWDVFVGFAPVLVGIAVAMADLVLRFAA
jgi:hypothetical protein